jgi:type VI secretion system protein ImpA
LVKCLHPPVERHARRARVTKGAWEDIAAMAPDLEELLQPIAVDAPCGTDLRYDATFRELEAAAEPEYEYQRGPDGREVARLKPRDWSKIGRGARALLAKGRDLRGQVLLLRSLLATDGLAGLAKGLVLVHRSLDDYWETLHPALDPGEEEPAEQGFQRLSVLGQITIAEGMLAELRRAPIIEAPGLGALTPRQIEIAQGRAQPVSGEEPIDEAQIDALLQAAGADAVAAAGAALATAQGALNGIAELFSTKLDATAVPDFRPMQQMLEEIDAVLAGHAAPQPAATAEPVAAAVSADRTAAPVADPPAPAPTTAAATLSRINDRGDVVRALDLVLDYYRREEPSSPIPLLLERIKKLVPMNFLDLMAELAPAGVPEFKALAGLEGEDG